MANALSPHPWVFWLAVGGPLLLRAWRRAPLRGVAFVVAFYALLLGTKIVLARIVAVARPRLGTRWYRITLAAAGVLLAAVGAVLLWEAVAAGPLVPS